MRQRPVVLYLALSTHRNEAINHETSLQFHQRIRDLLAGFRQIHPNVRIQSVVYPEEQLQQQVQLRSRSGLGPDLIIASADQANALLEHDLAVPMPLTPTERKAVDPLLLQRLQDPRGRLSGLPLLIQPQLACFDRRRLSQPIRSMTELTRRSRSDLRVGLSLHLPDLLWSAGSFGAVPALAEAARGQRPDAARQQALLTWLRWLQNSISRDQIDFQPSEQALRQSLVRGRLDWVSCNSAMLPILQRSLGSHLGVSPLPGHDGQAALQVRPLRAMVLGRDSSPLQRQLAIALSHYSFRPLVQRNFLIHDMVGLPVHRLVHLPSRRDGPLAAMEQALQQDRSPGSMALLAELHSDDPRFDALQETLIPLVFGVIDPEQAGQDVLRILQRRR